MRYEAEIDPFPGWMSFRQGNVLDPPPKSFINFFDVAISRNLALYLTREENRVAAAHHFSCLKEDGILALSTLEWKEGDSTAFAVPGPDHLPRLVSEVQVPAKRTSQMVL